MCCTRLAAMQGHTSRLFLGYRERFVDDVVVKLPKRQRVGGTAGGVATVSVSQRPTLPGPIGSVPGRAGQRLDDQHEVAQATGCTVWDGALLLGRAIASLPPVALRHSRAAGGTCREAETWRPKALEIGAGTGALGLSVAACGAVASMLLTDMAAVLPLTQANLTKNRSVLAVPARCVPLLWRADSRAVCEQLEAEALPEGMTPVQLIIGSDLLYRPDDGDEVGSGETRDDSQQAALLSTLSALLRPDSGTVGLIALVEHVEGMVGTFIQKATACGLEAALLEDYCAANDVGSDRGPESEGLRSALADAKETEPRTVLLRLESACRQAATEEPRQQQKQHQRQSKRRRRVGKVVVVELDRR